MTDDEVRRLGKREQIIITTNRRALRSQRFWYEESGNGRKMKPLGAVLEPKFEAATTPKQKVDEVHEACRVPDGLR